MTHHLKTLHPAAFALGYARLALGDLDLLLGGIHAIQIRQQQSFSIAGDYDHTVAFCVE